MSIPKVTCWIAGLFFVIELLNPVTIFVRAPLKRIHHRQLLKIEKTSFFHDQVISHHTDQNASEKKSENKQNQKNDDYVASCAILPTPVYPFQPDLAQDPMLQKAEDPPRLSTRSPLRPPSLA